jgi:hypothetical protein
MIAKSWCIDSSPHAGLGTRPPGAHAIQMRIEIDTYESGCRGHAESVVPARIDFSIHAIYCLCECDFVSGMRN